VRLCLDEPYSPQIASDLRDAGFDVVSVKERPELVGMSDAELLATMTAERRALVTENVGDFAPLVGQRAADGDAFFGIIYSANRTMPRSKATIGRYVAALTRLMERFPDEDGLIDRVEWLRPLANTCSEEYFPRAVNAAAWRHGGSKPWPDRRSGKPLVDSKP